MDMVTGISHLVDGARELQEVDPQSVFAKVVTDVVRVFCELRESEWPANIFQTDVKKIASGNFNQLEK
jgi:hypothetical protein